MKMKLVGVLCVAFAIVSARAADKAERPNILLIVADDLGYSDLGFQGAKDIPTPHLDRLAKEGMHCTSGYVSHPFCSPTRAGIMTGRYQQRFGHYNNPYYNPDDHTEGLPVSEKLLPAFLRDAGYVTGWVGKWHLGASPEFRPINRGFTETFGFIGGGHRYQDWKPNVATEYLVPIERNGKPVEVTNNLTIAFGHEAADFVARHKSEPWFLYLAFNAPHTPLEPTADRLDKFKSIQDVKRRRYAAQVSLLDDAIGETLASLRDSGQDKRTIVFFFSDNGGPVGANGNGSVNLPLRAGKGTVYEGGVHVPYVVNWPGKIPAGKYYAQPVSSLDVFATALSLAGAVMPTDKKYDSVNLLPFLTGEKSGSPHDQLFWRTSINQLAIRDGDQKLVREREQPAQLFDLAKDLIESNDLAAANADGAKKLGESLDAWSKDLPPPAFVGLGGKKKNAAGKKEEVHKPD